MVISCGKSGQDIHPEQQLPTKENKENTLTENVLLIDSLNRSTIGDIEGEIEFLPNGGIRSLGGKIIFDAGKVIPNGKFEVKMKGWTAPAVGVDKYHPLSGWENKGQYTHYSQKGSFWNWRIGAGYEPFKVLAAPLGIETRQELRVGSLGMVNADGTDAWHNYKVTWIKGKVEFFLDSVLIGGFTFNRFANRCFLIGKDNQYDLSNPAPVISFVKISEFK